MMPQEEVKRPQAVRDDLSAKLQQIVEARSSMFTQAPTAVESPQGGGWDAEGFKSVFESPTFGIGDQELQKYGGSTGLYVFDNAVPFAQRATRLFRSAPPEVQSIYAGKFAQIVNEANTYLHYKGLMELGADPELPTIRAGIAQVGNLFGALPQGAASLEELMGTRRKRVITQVDPQTGNPRMLGEEEGELPLGDILMEAGAAVKEMDSKGLGARVPPRLREALRTYGRTSQAAGAVRTVGEFMALRGAAKGATAAVGKGGGLLGGAVRQTLGRAAGEVGARWTQGPALGALHGAAGGATEAAFGQGFDAKIEQMRQEASAADIAKAGGWDEYVRTKQQDLGTRWGYIAEKMGKGAIEGAVSMAGWELGVGALRKVAGAAGLRPFADLGKGIPKDKPRLVQFQAEIKDAMKGQLGGVKSLIEAKVDAISKLPGLGRLVKGGAHGVEWLAGAKGAELVTGMVFGHPEPAYAEFLNEDPLVTFLVGAAFGAVNVRNIRGDLAKIKEKVAKNQDAPEATRVLDEMLPTMDRYTRSAAEQLRKQGIKDSHIVSWFEEIRGGSDEAMQRVVSVLKQKFSGTKVDELEALRKEITSVGARTPGQPGSPLRIGYEPGREVPGAERMQEEATSRRDFDMPREVAEAAGVGSHEEAAKVLDDIWNSFPEFATTKTAHIPTLEKAKDAVYELMRLGVPLDTKEALRWRELRAQVEEALGEGGQIRMAAEEYSTAKRQYAVETLERLQKRLLASRASRTLTADEVDILQRVRSLLDESKAKGASWVPPSDLPYPKAFGPQVRLRQPGKRPPPAWRGRNPPPFEEGPEGPQEAPGAPEPGPGPTGAPGLLGARVRKPSPAAAPAAPPPTAAAPPPAPAATAPAATAPAATAPAAARPVETRTDAEIARDFLATKTPKWLKAYTAPGRQNEVTVLMDNLGWTRHRAEAAFEASKRLPTQVTGIAPPTGAMGRIPQSMADEAIARARQSAAAEEFRLAQPRPDDLEAARRFADVGQGRLWAADTRDAVVDLVDRFGWKRDYAEKVWDRLQQERMPVPVEEPRAPMRTSPALRIGWDRPAGQVIYLNGDGSAVDGSGFVIRAPEGPLLLTGPKAPLGLPRLNPPQFRGATEQRLPPASTLRALRAAGVVKEKVEFVEAPQMVAPEAAVQQIEQAIAPMQPAMDAVAATPAMPTPPPKPKPQMEAPAEEAATEEPADIVLENPAPVPPGHLRVALIPAQLKDVDTKSRKDNLNKFYKKVAEAATFRDLRDFDPKSLSKAMKAFEKEIGKLAVSPAGRELLQGALKTAKKYLTEIFGKIDEWAQDPKFEFIGQTREEAAQRRKDADKQVIAAIEKVLGSAAPADKSLDNLAKDLLKETTDYVFGSIENVYMRADGGMEVDVALHPSIVNATTTDGNAVRPLFPEILGILRDDYRWRNSWAGNTYSVARNGGANVHPAPQFGFDKLEPAWGKMVKVAPGTYVVDQIRAMKPLLTDDLRDIGHFGRPDKTGEVPFDLLGRIVKHTSREGSQVIEYHEWPNYFSMSEEGRARRDADLKKELEAATAAFQEADSEAAKHLSPRDLREMGRTFSDPATLEFIRKLGGQHYLESVKDFVDKLSDKERERHLAEAYKLRWEEKQNTARRRKSLMEAAQRKIDEAKKADATPQTLVRYVLHNPSEAKAELRQGAVRKATTAPKPKPAPAAPPPAPKPVETPATTSPLTGKPVAPAKAKPLPTVEETKKAFANYEKGGDPDKLLKFLSKARKSPEVTEYLKELARRDDIKWDARVREYVRTLIGERPQKKKGVKADVIDPRLGEDESTFIESVRPWLREARQEMLDYPDFRVVGATELVKAISKQLVGALKRRGFEAKHTGIFISSERGEESYVRWKGDSDGQQVRIGINSLPPGELPSKVGAVADIGVRIAPHLIRERLEEVLVDAVLWKEKRWASWYHEKVPVDPKLPMGAALPGETGFRSINTEFKKDIVKADILRPAPKSTEPDDLASGGRDPTPEEMDALQGRSEALRDLSEVDTGVVPVKVDAGKEPERRTVTRRKKEKAAPPVEVPKELEPAVAAAKAALDDALGVAATSEKSLAYYGRSDSRAYIMAVDGKWPVIIDFSKIPKKGAEPFTEEPTYRQSQKMISMLGQMPRLWRSATSEIMRSGGGLWGEAPAFKPAGEVPKDAHPLRQGVYSYDIAFATLVVDAHNSGDTVARRYLEPAANMDRVGSGTWYETQIGQFLAAAHGQLLAAAKRRGWLKEAEDGSGLVPTPEMLALAQIVDTAMWRENGYQWKPERKAWYPTLTGDNGIHTRRCSDCTLGWRRLKRMADKEKWTGALRRAAELTARVFRGDNRIGIPWLAAEKYVKEFTNPEHERFRKGFMARQFLTLRNRFGDVLGSVLSKWTDQKLLTRENFYSKMRETFSDYRDVPELWETKSIDEIKDPVIRGKAMELAEIADALEGKRTADSLSPKVREVYEKAKKVYNEARQFLAGHVFRHLRRALDVAIAAKTATPEYLFRRWGRTLGDDAAARDPKVALKRLLAQIELEPNQKATIEGMEVHGWGLRDYFPHIWPKTPHEGDGLHWVQHPSNMVDGDEIEVGKAGSEHPGEAFERWRIQLARNYGKEHGFVSRGRWMRNLMARLEGKDGYTRDARWVMRSYLGSMMDKVFHERLTDDMEPYLFGVYTPLYDKAIDGAKLQSLLLKVPTDETNDRLGSIGSIDEYFSMKAGNLAHVGERYVLGGDGQWVKAEPISKENIASETARLRGERWRWNRGKTRIADNPAEWRLALASRSEMFVLHGREAIKAAGLEVRDGGTQNFTTGESYQAIKGIVREVAGYDMDSGKWDSWVESNGAFARVFMRASEAVNNFIYQAVLGGSWLNPKAFFVQFFEGSFANAANLDPKVWAETVKDMDGSLGFYNALVHARNPATEYEAIKARFASSAYVKKVLPVLEAGQWRPWHLLRTDPMTAAAERTGWLRRYDEEKGVWTRRSLAGFTIGDVLTKTHAYYAAYRRSLDVKEWTNPANNRVVQIIPDYIQPGDTFTHGLSKVSAHDIARMVVERTHFTLPRYAQPGLMKMPLWSIVGHLGTQATNITFEFFNGLVEAAKYLGGDQNADLWRAQTAGRYFIGMLLAFNIASLFGRDIGDYTGAHISDVGIGPVSIGSVIPQTRQLPYEARFFGYQLPRTTSLPMEFWFGKEGVGVPSTLADLGMRAMSGSLGPAEAMETGLAQWWRNWSPVMGLGPGTRGTKPLLNLMGGGVTYTDVDPERPWEISDVSYFGRKKRVKYRSMGEMVGELLFPGRAYPEAVEFHRARASLDTLGMRGKIAAELRRDLTHPDLERRDEAVRKLRDMGLNVQGYRVQRMALAEKLTTAEAMFMQLPSLYDRAKFFLEIAPDLPRARKARLWEAIMGPGRRLGVLSDHAKETFPAELKAQLVDASR